MDYPHELARKFSIPGGAVKRRHSQTPARRHLAGRLEPLPQARVVVTDAPVADVIRLHHWES